jgi:hypothetical protein
MTLRAARDSVGDDVAGEMAGGVEFNRGVSGKVSECPVSGWVPPWALEGIGVGLGVDCPGSENPRVGGSIPSLAIP